MAPPRNVTQAATELEQFFDLSIDLLCVVGFDGYFKRVNSAWERTLGYSRRGAVRADRVRHHPPG